MSLGCKDQLYCIRINPQTGAPELKWKHRFQGTFEGREIAYLTEACPAVRSDGRIYLPVYTFDDAPGLLLAINRDGTEA